MNADPTTDPAAGFVLEVCDERERLAKRVTDSPWRGGLALSGGHGFLQPADAEHIAAEANPDAVLADVALWREAAKWWMSIDLPEPHGLEDTLCRDCALFAAVVAAARAYVGEA